MDNDEVLVDTKDSVLQEAGLETDIKVYEDIYQKGVRDESIKHLRELKDFLLEELKKNDTCYYKFNKLSTFLRKDVCNFMKTELLKIFPVVNYREDTIPGSITKVTLFTISIHHEKSNDSGNIENEP
jgi:hypothetical protein